MGCRVIRRSKKISLKNEHTVHLRAGDHINLPAHTKHKVSPHIAPVGVGPAYKSLNHMYNMAVFSVNSEVRFGIGPAPIPALAGPCRVSRRSGWPCTINSLAAETGDLPVYPRHYVSL